MTTTPVIVTGGAGFIGSHACKCLAEAGYLPVTIDNLRTGHADAVRWGPLEKLDVRDTDAVAHVFRRHSARTVIHFAACAYVGESVEQPGLYYDNNVGGMISLLSAMKREGVGQIVFSSSCATYGIPNTVPISETSQQAPINPYGRTKLICEMMIRDHAAAHGLRYAMLRYFNAAGAAPDGALSERHDPETHLIPLALMAASGMGPPLRVFGGDYPTPDGTCIRDYIHVSDLAEAHLLALRHLEAGRDDLVLNLGTGRGTSIHELLQAIARQTGCDVPYELAPRRPGDPAELVAAPELAERVLNFRARRSDIDSIIKDAAPHFAKENCHGVDA
ncbi:UDP-glucose 4-epimerase GalE [Primorskyibacter aestuariivivens]|uniref:UDP-glucose 4-epimerase GalE n=1 Tax=Primorskyibacter aestuariivivens TaxID=1888912 RepID=UPI002301C32A|nr:UDP-glucose 4-epimerase GalE [Primorskyibacter aestuariivivens]MDA7430554.1 UDP-glucose 4-epimerase GalE [Primorskyibacter aestuariivivens]